MLILLNFPLLCPAAADSGERTGSFVPPPDNFSWIQLTSDEWLKGDIISLFNEVLIFDSDNLGELKIDWEDVRILRSHGSYEVSFPDNSTSNGALLIEGDRVQIIRDQDVEKVSREEVVALAVTVRREIDRWDADFGFGLNVRRGNSSTFESNLSAGFVRRTSISRLVGDYLGSFNETEGVEVARSHRANMTLDRHLRGSLFWRVANLEYLQDPFVNLRHQATLETGLGYSVYESAKSTWEVIGGVGANYTQYISVAEGESDQKTSPVITVGTTFETELTSWIDFDVGLGTTLLDEASGKYQHHLISTLSTDLIGDVDLDVTLVWDRLQQPQQREDGTFPQQDDFRLVFGLGYEF